MPFFQTLPNFSWLIIGHDTFGPQDEVLKGNTVTSHNPDHSHNSQSTWPNEDMHNSKLQTLNSELWNIALNWIAIHSGPDLSIWISLLHLYIVYCLIVLVVLTITYVPWLLYPSLYYLALVLFWMYLAMTLPSHLMFYLAWNYKVPVSCNHSTVRILKSSGSIPCAIKTHPHSASWISVLLLLHLSSPHLIELQALILKPEPMPEIPRLQQKVGAVHKLKPTSRTLHLASLWWSSIPTLNSKPQVIWYQYQCFVTGELNRCDTLTQW